MSVERSIGLILRTRPLTETSLIVQWLGAGCGRVSTVARGALRPKSAFRGKLDLFFLAEFSFARSRHSELHTLAEVVVLDPHPRLRTDLGRLHQAAYLVAFVERTTETGTPVNEVFALARDFLRHLDRAEAVRALDVLALELQLLTLLGLAPDLAAARLVPEARAVAGRCLAREWTDPTPLEAGRSPEQALRRFLHGFLIHHLGSLPVGRAGALGGAEV